MKAKQLSNRSVFLSSPDSKAKTEKKNRPQVGTQKSNSFTRIICLLLLNTNDRFDHMLIR